MSEFTAADEVIQKSLRSFGDSFYIKYLRQSIFYNWSNIIGAVNAAKIKPLRIEYKNLFVYINDSTWKTTLYAYKPLFIQKINEYVKKNLIDEIILGNPNEKPAEDNENIVIARQSEEENIVNEIKQIVLTEDEFNEIKESCAKIDDDELRKTMIKVSISRLKLQKYRLSKNWHKCAICESLCPEEQKICDFCKRKRVEEFRSKISKIFYEIPCSSYADILNDIKKTMPDMESECIPETVESIRTSIIQRAANSLDLNNKQQVSFLVMLYTRRPAEQLNQQMIDKTLYQLRYDLPINSVDFKTMHIRKTKRPTM